MIDSHAHIQMPPLVDEWEALYDRAKLAGIEGIVVVGEGMESSEHALRLAKERDDLWATIGVHPEHAPQLEKGWKDAMEHLAIEGIQSGKLKAIGEIGLDYHWITQQFHLRQPLAPRLQRSGGFGGQAANSDSTFTKASSFTEALEDESVDKQLLAQKKAQRDVFEWQIELANRYNLPIVIHSREAGEDTLAILRDHPPRYALMHCYSYDVETAEAFLAMNPRNMIAFTGILTFPNAKALRDVCQAIPLERILTESDCPYLAPQKYRGQQNEPAYIVEIVKKIAELKGLSFEEVARVTGENARRFFGL